MKEEKKAGGAVGAAKALSAVRQQLLLNRWLRRVAVAFCLGWIGLLGYSKTDLLILAPSSVQGLIREIVGQHPLVAAAIGLANGVAFVLAERRVVSRQIEAFRSFLVTPILARYRGHAVVLAWSILPVFALVLAPMALIVAVGFSLGAYSAGLVLTMGLLQSGFERLTFLVHEELTSECVPDGL